MYTVEIRRTNGEQLAEGRGRDWRHTAERLYAVAHPTWRPRRRLSLAHHCPSTGGPLGTWHCQFGYAVRTGGESLDDLVVVHVSE